MVNSHIDGVAAINIFLCKQHYILSVSRKQCNTVPVCLPEDSTLSQRNITGVKRDSTRPHNTMSLTQQEEEAICRRLQLAASREYIVDGDLLRGPQKVSVLYFFSPSHRARLELSRHRDLTDGPLPRVRRATTMHGIAANLQVPEERERQIRVRAEVNELRNLSFRRRSGAPLEWYEELPQLFFSRGWMEDFPELRPEGNGRPEVKFVWNGERGELQRGGPGASPWKWSSQVRTKLARKTPRWLHPLSGPCSYNVRRWYTNAQVVLVVAKNIHILMPRGQRHISISAQRGTSRVRTLQSFSGPGMVARQALLHRPGEQGPAARPADAPHSPRRRGAPPPPARGHRRARRVAVDKSLFAVPRPSASEKR